MHCGEKCKRSLIIILYFCCQHAYSVPKLSQHNLRWKFSYQSFSYKSKKLGFEPIVQARSFLFPVTWQAGCLWVTHMDGLNLDVGTWWKGKTHFPPFVWPFKKISLFTIFSCACKPYCFLPVPSFTWVSPNWSSNHAGWLVQGPHYPRPFLLPCSCKYPFPFPGTYVTCLQSRFSHDIFLEYLEFFNHNNNPVMYRSHSHFMNEKTEVQGQTVCQKEADRMLSPQLERNSQSTVITSLPL